GSLRQYATPQDFDGDDALWKFLLRAVDDAHAARAQHADDLIWADCLRHCCDAERFGRQRLRISERRKIDVAGQRRGVEIERGIAVLCQHCPDSVIDIWIVAASVRQKMIALSRVVLQGGIEDVTDTRGLLGSKGLR